MMTIIFDVKRGRNGDWEMRYPAAETAEKHARILDAASRMFRDRGFSDVSVAEIMKATGLTHGPFYNHFSSKHDLMAEAIRHASAQSFDGLDKADSSEAGKAAYQAEYLSTAHRDNKADGCLIAALASEIGREPSVRAAVTGHIRALIDRMASKFPWPAKRAARADAIRMTASMLGAVILARAVDDEALSEEILRAAAGQR